MKEHIYVVVWTTESPGINLKQVKAETGRVAICKVLGLAHTDADMDTDYLDDFKEKGINIVAWKVELEEEVDDLDKAIRKRIQGGQCVDIAEAAKAIGCPVPTLRIHCASLCIGH